MEIELNGSRIFFDVAGSSLRIVDGHLVAKPTIIAIHGGLGFDHGYLKPGLEQLSNVAQIVFIDLRGQGRSGRPSLETCTLEQMADDVTELCRILGISRPIIFGHSAGGFVAMRMALRHPRLIGGLILCDTSPSVAPVREDDEDEKAPGLTDRAGPEVLAVAGRVFGGDISEESISQFFKVVCPFYFGPAHMRLADHILSLTTPDIRMMKHFMQKIAPTYDIMGEIGTIKTSTLVMVGRYDWVCPPRASRAIAKTLPSAQLVEFQESGHFIFSEEPQKFHDTVSAYLERLEYPVASDGQARANSAAG